MAEPGRDENPKRDENLDERDKGIRDTEIKRETNIRNALDNVETPAVRREDLTDSEMHDEDRQSDR
jgi:hypothetical protein